MILFFKFILSLFLLHCWYFLETVLLLIDTCYILAILYATNAFLLNSIFSRFFMFISFELCKDQYFTFSYVSESIQRLFFLG